MLTRLCLHSVCFLLFWAIVFTSFTRAGEGGNLTQVQQSAGPELSLANTVSPDTHLQILRGVGRRQHSDISEYCLSVRYIGIFFLFGYLIRVYESHHVTRFGFLYLQIRWCLGLVWVYARRGAHQLLVCPRVDLKYQHLQQQRYLCHQFWAERIGPVGLIDTGSCSSGRRER